MTKSGQTSYRGAAAGGVGGPAAAKSVLSRACGAVAALFLAALFWAQFRSFDMFDGAFYFLLYHDPSDFSDTQTRFHLLARPIWLLSGQNIIVFRLVSIGLLSAACLVFWRQWRGFFVRTGGSSLGFWPLWMATMAGLTWVPVALTYNSLATFFDLLALAVFFSLIGSIAGGASGRAATMVKVAALMICLYGAYFAKPPAAGALVLAFFGICCTHPFLKPRLRKSVALAGLACLVAALAVIAYVVTRPDFNRYKPFYIIGLLFTPNSLLVLFERYGAEFAHVMPAIRGDLAWIVAPVLLAAGLASLPKASNRRLTLAQSVALGLLLFTLATVLVVRGLWDASYSNAVSGEGSRFYFVVWASLVPVWLVCLRRAPAGDEARLGRRAVWVASFLLLPLISSIGSTNTMYVSALHSTVLWVAGLLLVSESIGIACGSSWFCPATAALLFAAASAHVFSGHFLRPYENQISLWRQTAAVDIGSPPTRLKVDPALASFIGRIRSVMDSNGYRAGDDVFGFFNLPGIIFAIGAKEPGSPWYFGTWYHQENIDDIKLQRVPLRRRKDAWIISQADITRFRSEFARCEIDFPDGYQELFRTTNPVTGLEIGVWKPRKPRPSP